MTPQQIDAMKLALDLATMHHTDDGYAALRAKVRSASKEALAQPEQEPVAWRDAAIRLGEELSSVGPDGYYNMNAKQWLDWAMAQNPSGKHSLPQRTWVGLTDEDWDEIFGNSLTIGAAIKNTEARIKQKNGYAEEKNT